MSDKQNISMNLEDILGDRFGKYSKYIIQERALPDVRDGLKPVQRRILYAMHKEGNVQSKPFRKSAKTVGVVIGNYHPHGDTSVYDAMVRLSQDWKLLAPLVEMHGNNGSIDNDPPAAMRYTEARLSALSSELLQDLDKKTVLYALNFDDTEEEPTVLPAKYPNLLINGATGISAGYATDIPPHNLVEIIDATIKRLESQNCRLDTILDIVKGPDFPTGGIVQGKKGIQDALAKGKGRVVVRSRVEIVEEKNKYLFVVTEIPYEVNKGDMVRKIDDIRISRQIEGIIEVRDETDRSGLRVVVEVRKDVDHLSVLNYLYKNTDLQKYYNYNMVAIKEQRPVLMGILEILDAYIEHRIEVVTKRTIFELNRARDRMHIIEGLIYAVSILDEVIKIIRHSKDKADAKNNLIAKYAFTEIQAEAIVILRLYRLTSTDVTILVQEKEALSLEIERLSLILDSDEVLRSEIKKELVQIKKAYGKERQTKIEDEISEIVINKEAMVVSEDIMISVTRAGYIKKISLRSYGQSPFHTCGKREGDQLVSLFEANSLQHILVFMASGEYLFIPVHQLEEAKWKEVGKHISYLVNVSGDDQVVQVMLVDDFNKNLQIVSASSAGFIKQTQLADFVVQRNSKSIKYMNLKNDDYVVSVDIANMNEEVLITTQKGYNARYNLDDITITGTKTAGVKAINLKDDFVVSMKVIKDNTRSFVILAEDGGYKRMRVSDLNIASRNSKGHRIVSSKATQSIKFTRFCDPSDEMLLYFVDDSEVYLPVKSVNYAEANTAFSYPNQVKSKKMIDYVFTNDYLSTLMTHVYNEPTSIENEDQDESDDVLYTNLSFDI